MVNTFPLAGESTEHCRVAEYVHQSGDATAVAKDRGEGIVAENLPAIGAGDEQTMFDVIAGLGFVQRAQVKAQPHALCQLLQAPRVELVVQFRLAH